LAVYGKDDLWLFTYEKGRVRFKDYEQYCKNGRFQEGKTSKLNKETMNRFLNELREEKKIVWGIGENGFKYNYVPQNMIDEVKKLIENRRLSLELESLSKEERDKILYKKLSEDQDRILSAIGQNGELFIREIAQKTGFTELKVEETIWGPMVYTGTISSEKHAMVDPKYRKYSLTVLGLYRALRADMGNFEIIIAKWGFLHPFVFDRLELIRKHKLELVLKEYIARLRLEPSMGETEEQTLQRIENYLIALMISGYNYKFLKNWFGLINEDREFRERVKNCFKGFIEGFQKRIAGFQYGLETIDMVGRRQPDWEEIKWREMPFVGLEVFMHFKEIDWDYCHNRRR